MAPPWVGGVASGIAARYGFPVAAVRTAFAALGLLGGLGVALYIWLWLTSSTDEQITAETQVAGPATQAYRAPMREVGERRDTQVVAGRLFVVGVAFLVVAAVTAFLFTLFGTSGLRIFWPVLTVAGMWLVWFQAPRVAGRKLGPIGLVVLGTLVAVIGALNTLYAFGLIPTVASGLTATLVVFIVAALTLAPLALRVVRDLTASQAREAREVERADIAAHLHDSVLQTLTLIRGAADDPTRVRALALTQEHELRSWLYTGSVEPEVSVAEALGKQAAEIEATYGTAIEVVTVGDMTPGPRQSAAIAAAAEAMTNAVRHGRPPITVFQEARDGNLEIYVKDAGTGFDFDAIASDRHGLRNSIIGRVERVGGEVDVRFLPPSEPSPFMFAEDGAPGASVGEGEGNGSAPNFGGTEVRIKLPRSADDQVLPVSSHESERETA